jgi:hypothetical protein
VWLGRGAAVSQLVYLLTVLPAVDTDLVVYFAGSRGSGGFEMQLSPASGATISGALLIVGAAVAAVALGLLRAERRAAAGIAVVGLAIIALSVALQVAGYIAAFHNDAITGLSLWSLLPVSSVGAVFLSLVPLSRSTGKRVQVQ